MLFSWGPALTGRLSTAFERTDKNGRQQKLRKDQNGRHNMRVCIAVGNGWKTRKDGAVAGRKTRKDGFSRQNIRAYVRMHAHVRRRRKPNGRKDKDVR